MIAILSKTAQSRSWVFPLLGTALGWGASAVYIPSVSLAQIVPDTTLSPSGIPTDQNSIVNPTAIVDESPATLIEGGALRSSNLFHSFQEFNVQANQRVYFADPSGVDNIFTRVTGGSASGIFGTLGVDGAANLFLLNPNGVIFGENAQLDIDGSFVTTTAESVDFGGGKLFSANNPQTVPLLTVNTPIGLQYGSATAEVRVEGTGSQVFFNFETGLTDKRFRPFGLTVPAGQTLALLGGEVTVDGGNLTSAGGNIELAAVTTGYLPLSDGSSGYLPFQLVDNISTVNLPAGTLLGDLLVTGGGSLEASGDPAGNVRLLANNIEFNEGATLFMDTLGSADGGSLQAFAPESITLYGFGDTGLDPFYSTTWSTLVPVDGTGRGADVSVNTGSFQLLNGGFLLTETNGTGNAGNVTIQAEEVTVAEINPFVLVSVLGSYVGVGADGNGGNLTINTQRLTLADSSVTGVQTRGNGNSGNVTITATEFVKIDTQLPDFVPFPLLTRLSSEAAPITVFGTSDPPAGNAGNISITTPNLQILNGSQLRSSNSGSGNGGNVKITADTVEIDGTGEALAGFVSFSPLVIITDEVPSAISAVVSDPGSGNAGELRMDVGQLRLSNGGLVSNSSLGDGAGGNVIIEARERIELVGTNPDGAIASGIYSRAVAGEGSGGDINLFTPQLVIRDGATVNVGNFDTLGDEAPGTGPAGNIDIVATTVQLSNAASLSADTLLNADALSGRQGSISVEATDLTLSQDSRISTNADGTGSGGNIEVDADTLRLLSNSELVANANGTGSAGNINVDAPQSLYLSQSKITASGGQGNLSLASPTVLLREGSLVATDARGNSAGGNILVDSNFLIAFENSDITANAEQSFGGQVVVNAQSIIGTDYRLQLTPESDITATSELGPDLNGTVELNTLDVDPTQGLFELPASFADASNSVVESCREQAGVNSLIVSGRGGVPEDPGQLLGVTDAWVDFRLLSPDQAASVEEPTSARSGETTTDTTQFALSQSELVASEPATSELAASNIVEAQGVVVKDDSVILVASATTRPQLAHNSRCTKAL